MTETSTDRQFDTRRGRGRGRRVPYRRPAPEDELSFVSSCSDEDIVSEDDALFDTDEEMPEISVAEEEAMEVNDMISDKIIFGRHDTKTTDRLQALAENSSMPAQAKKAVSGRITMPVGDKNDMYYSFVEKFPFGKTSGIDIDVDKVRGILDQNHYGMQNVKERILEYLVGLKYMAKKDGRSTSGRILCLNGDPGTGKTSIAKSIAAALGKKVQVISMNTMEVSFSLTGMNLSWDNSQPGAVVKALIAAGCMDPVIIFDEIDKASTDYNHGPSVMEALMSVLDPSQNGSFTDAYFDFPVDLSGVLFICTSNTLKTIPEPLRDRMEIIQIEGYDENEKVVIARDYILPGLQAKYGIDSSLVNIPDSTLAFITANYTMESGVRHLQKTLESVVLKSLSRLETQSGSLTVTEEMISEWFGAPVHLDVKVGDAVPEPGIVTGLAVASGFGGLVMQTEAVSYPGRGGLILSGSLGQTMQESAKVALGVVKSLSSRYHIPEGFFATHDVQLNYPDLAMPKDGPSGGLAATVAILSAVTGVPVDPAVAMTGEISLTGRILPVGGIRQKVTAAIRAGCTDVVIPADHDSSDDAFLRSCRDRIRIHSCSELQEVLPLCMNIPEGVQTKKIGAVR